MTEELIRTAAQPDLKRRKLFLDGTKIVAAINSAERTQGRFAPGLAVELKTILPQLGYSLRHQAWFSTRKADGSHYVKPGGDLDLLLRLGTCRLMPSISWNAQRKPGT